MSYTRFLKIFFFCVCVLVDGDLYVAIGGLFKSNIHAQTYRGHRERNYSARDKLKVCNVKNIQMSNLPGWAWTPACDHSKWCVTENQNRDWVCIADVNRESSQLKRRGGALCLENRNVKNTFLSFMRTQDNCDDRVTNPQPCTTGQN